MDVKVTEKIDTAPVSDTAKSKKFSVLDFIVILALGCLLFCGISAQLFYPRDDAAKYECYATAFWGGSQAVKNIPGYQCHFLASSQTPLISQKAFVNSLIRHHFPDPIVHFFASQSNTSSLHALPHEYPALALIPFSISLLAPIKDSQIAFGLGMVALAIAMYLMLLRYRSRQAAIMCAVYLVAGGWDTVAGRFDLVPAVLTFVAFLCGTRQRWWWSFALLALATMTKLYPVYLVPAFLLAQQLTSHLSWRNWRRWAPLGVYAGTCAAILIVSLALNVEGTLAPLSYFKNRPVQIESFSASLLWLVSAVTQHHLHYEFTFGSLNIVNTSSTRYSLPGTLMLVAGLLYTLWLQWKKKIDFAAAILLTLLIVILATKVFSPQYLIWVIPFIAYVGEGRLRWIILWVTVCLLTTWIFPYIYEMAPLARVGYLSIFHRVVAIRNFLMLGFTLALLVVVTRRAAPVPSDEAQITDR